MKFCLDFILFFIFIFFSDIPFHFMLHWNYFLLLGYENVYRILLFWASHISFTVWVRTYVLLQATLPLLKNVITVRTHCVFLFCGLHCVTYSLVHCSTKCFVMSVLCRRTKYQTERTAFAVNIAYHLHRVNFNVAVLSLPFLMWNLHV